METTKNYLSSINPWISEMEIYGVVKSLTRISEKKWRNIIYTERDQRVYIRKKTLSMDWNECGQIEM